VGGDELSDIGVGEHVALALLAVPQGDVFQRARGDVTVDRPDRAAELYCSVVFGEQAVRRPNAGPLPARLGRFAHHCRCSGWSEAYRETAGDRAQRYVSQC
jgi:hypothetical protein